MAVYSRLKSFKDQFTPLPPVEMLDLSGRVIIVTGANSGLGLEASRHFASMRPSKLILAVRTISKGEAAKEDIVSSLIKTHNDLSSRIEVWLLDMASFESVKAFSQRASKLDRLDVAVLNAGIATDQWKRTDDGFEATIQTNVIATGLLAVLLYPTLLRTSALPVPSETLTLKPHITFCGSGAALRARYPERIDNALEVIQDQAQYHSAELYECSKLMGLLVTRELARHAANGRVVINNVNPGFCRSNLLSGVSSVFARCVMTIMRTLLARSTEMGSRTLIWASLNNTRAGAYSSNCAIEEESDFVLSELGQKAQAKLWEDLRVIWDRVAPESTFILQGVS